MTPYLSDDELLGICCPIRQPAAMIRALKGMGFLVKRRPNGWPLVSRANFDAVMMGQAAAQATAEPGSGPNVQALLDRFRQNGAPYGDGQKTQKQPARAT